MVRTKEMPANPKQVLNCIVDAEESLGLAARLEAAHLSFSLSGPLVRDLGPVVLIWPSQVENRWNQLSMDDDVAPQLVGDEAVGSRPLAFHEFPEEPPGSPTIASLLEENVDRVPVLVDRPPEVETLSPDRDKEFVQMPNVAQSAFPAPQPSGISWPEFETPVSDRLVRNVDPSFRQEILNLAETERESMVEPYRVTDDRGWEAVAEVAGRVSHPVILADGQLP